MSAAMRICLIGLVLSVLAAGCGGSERTSKARPPGASSTRLTITVWPKGKPGVRAVYTLACPQGAGSLPSAAAACSKLSRLGARAFAPVPRGVACTEIYGGPQTAQVSGLFRGERISAVFNRVDGCEIARWNRLAFLFPTGS
jgi:hypothetical protein